MFPVRPRSSRSSARTRTCYAWSSTRSSPRVSRTGTEIRGNARRGTRTTCSPPRFLHHRFQRAPRRRCSPTPRSITAPRCCGLGSAVLRAGHPVSRRTAVSLPPFIESPLAGPRRARPPHVSGGVLVCAGRPPPSRLCHALGLDHLTRFFCSSCIGNLTGSDSAAVVLVVAARHERHRDGDRSRRAEAEHQDNPRASGSSSMTW